MTITADEFIGRILIGESLPWDRIDHQDEERFLKITSEHRVNGLLINCMASRPEWNTWPVPVRRFLELHQKKQVMAGMLRRNQLQKILESFRKAGVRSVLIKGESLALTHYADESTRERCDTDIFIDIKQIQLARKALSSAGFVDSGPVFKSHQFIVRPGNITKMNVEFDIHWRIQNSFVFARSLYFDDVYDRSRSAPGLENGRVMSDTDALLLSCMHLAGNKLHNQNCLLWLYDIHLLISGMQRSQLLEVSEQASRVGANNVCSIAFDKSKSLFKTAISDEVFEVLRFSNTALPHQCGVNKSHMGLLLSDFAELPGVRPRVQLLWELLSLTKSQLEQKSESHSVGGLLWLYFRYLVSSGIRRMLIR